MGWFKQQKFIVSQFCGLELVLRGLSPQLVGGHLLTVSSFALPSVGLSPDLLFLQGHQSCWIRAQAKDLMLS